ncbi:MAG: spermidine/putrescine ABC transporter substrate-binding protein [Sporolactobacillus sp.]|jgi:spermidine/putrescine-binding protein|nr:spermidine/putrescine ABC transporter substrate-binding protein [Sporolactobacillus sp.]
MVWTEYLPQSVVHGFEKKYGIKVNQTTYDDPSAMASKVESAAKGTYDMLIGPGLYIQVFNKLQLLSKLNQKEIPNMKYLNKRYLNQAFDKKNEYGLPYQGASLAIAVNRSKIKDQIETYQDLLNPKYKNQMVTVNDSRALVGVGLMANGYSLNDTSNKALAAATRYLKKLRPNIKVFDGTSPKTEMLNGETNIGLIYGAEIALAMEKNKNINVIYPKKGGIYFGTDMMMKFAGGKNTKNVEKFINYICDPKISAKISKVYPYVNPNKGAVELLPPSYRNNPAKNIPDSVAKRAEPLLDIGKDTTKVQKVWDDFKGGYK